MRGKHKPTYTPHVDCGDYVIVVNAEKITLTGKKWDQRCDYNNSGYNGGLSLQQLKECCNFKFPTRMVEKAIGMLPAYTFRKANGG